MSPRWRTVALGSALVVDADERDADASAQQLAGYFPVHTVSSAGAAMDALAKQQVRAVVVDVVLPEVSGLELIDQMRRSAYEMPIMAVSRQGLMALGNVLDMLDARYVVKGCGWLANVEAFAERSFAASFRIGVRTLRTIGREAVTRALTVRERQVLLLVFAGLSRSEMAQELSISPWTLKTHLRNLVAKFEATDLADVIDTVNTCSGMP